MQTSRGSVLVSERSGHISTVMMQPKTATHLMILGHGAGAGMDHKFMVRLTEALAVENIATLRYQFPYMENGKRRPDVPNVAHKTIERVVEEISQTTELPLLLAGKSFGGRMASQLMAKKSLDRIEALVFFGFPLHSPAKPGNDRGDHLRDVNIPMLFLQGDRDALAKLSLLQPLLEQLPLATLQVLPGANHGFAFTKKSGISEIEGYKLLATHTRTFINKI